MPYPGVREVIFSAGDCRIDINGNVGGVSEIKKNRAGGEKNERLRIQN